MGRHEHGRIRKVKLVSPSKSHWVAALSNAWKTRTSVTFSRVRVRCRSMTTKGQQREYELRQECKERNEKLDSRVWLVYRDE